jgi:hypothetical protein
MSSPSGDVVYHGVKSSHTGAVITVETLDGEVVGVVRHIAAHSPGGMTWGYGGSGPLDCARSLLTAAWAATASGTRTAAPASSGTSGDEVVARLSDEWRMSRSEILAWLDRRRA